MTWFVAASYVLTMVLLLVAGPPRLDPKLRRLLGAADGSWFVSLKARCGRWLERVTGLVLSPRLRARAEHMSVTRAVPDLLDLLAVSVSAGLSPRLALERVPDVFPGRLAQVLATVRRDVAVGTPWRLALEAEAERTDTPDLRRLARALHGAERLGSPVGERLKDLAAQVRAERRARREERARRAPVQMLFPLVFLILPAFVLAAVVPALLVATRDLA